VKTLLQLTKPFPQRFMISFFFLPENSLFSSEALIPAYQGISFAVLAKSSFFFYAAPKSDFPPNIRNTAFLPVKVPLFLRIFPARAG